MAAPPRNVQVRTLDSRDSTILVVDDEAAGRDLLSSLLSSQGYSVKTASDGESALAQLALGGIRLVLLDLMMAKMDGVEVCTHIRRDPSHALLPVVFTTSLHDRASRIRAKEAGADDFLVKPIDGLELLVRVERLLRVRAQTELLTAERDRLARELSRARAVSLGEPVAAAPTPALSLEELAHEHRRLVADALRVSALTEGQDIRPILEALLRSAEEIERRVSGPSISFPWTQTRSTL
ncbi:MAG TPA: response regulator [Polyangiales bacterium]